MRIGVLVAGLVLGGWAGMARAAESDGLRVDLSTGLSVMSTVKGSTGDADSSMGLTQGLTIDGRKGMALYGGTAEAATSVFGRDEYFLAANGGLVGSPDRGPEVILLGEVGAHFLQNVGSGFWDRENGSATLPYAGLRLGMGQASHRGHGDWGVWLYGRVDLARQTVMPTSWDCFLECSDMGPFRVGGLTVGASMRYLFGSGRSRPVGGGWAGDDL